MELPLRDYLGGHVLRKAMLRFEDAMGPWVKAEVKAFFCHKLEIALDDDDHRTAEYESTLKAHESTLETHNVEMTRLLTRRDELAKLIRTCPNKERQAVAQEKNVVGEQIKIKQLELDTAPSPLKPIPRWVEECRVFLGPP